ncbi:MAG: transcription antitermination factor NusB [Elusimicrobiota bacterium]
MGLRREARELALKVLYIFETAKTDRDTAWKTVAGDFGSEKIKSFAKRLVWGTLDNLSFIDSLIAKHARHWTIERIAVVDKSVMRMAIYEIFFEETIPKVVSINEAVELAKKYSTENSHKFVNGILDDIKVTEK